MDLDDFDSDFERLDDLNIPWRWADANPALGEWLRDTRARLVNGCDPDFRGAPVALGSVGDARFGACGPAQIKTCKSFATANSVVAIRHLRHEAHETAKNLGGAFTSMEEMDCHELFAAADQLDGATGHESALAMSSSPGSA